MPRAIDLHVHLPTEEWLGNSIGPHLEATEEYFRAHVPRKSIDEVAEEYASRDILGIVLDWDDETVTGRGWMGNDWLAGLAEKLPAEPGVTVQLCSRTSSGLGAGLLNRSM